MTAEASWSFLCDVDGCNRRATVAGRDFYAAERTLISVLGWSAMPDRVHACENHEEDQ